MAPASSTPPKAPSPPALLLLHPAQRVSAYDNLSGSAGEDNDADDDVSDDGTVTEFSEPWDSSRWDRLLASPASPRRLHHHHQMVRRSNAMNPAASCDSGVVCASADFGVSVSRPGTPLAPATTPPEQNPVRLLRTRSFKDRMDPLLASPRLLALRATCDSQAGKSLQVCSGESAPH